MGTDKVLTCTDQILDELDALLRRYGIQVTPVASDTPIPGSFWGDPEAGLIDNLLYVRADTPVHSALHESCHYICMDAQRRDGLNTDAGGDYDEENGVCYLQILLADELASVGAEHLMKDMDRWGYSFRLGSALSWFMEDAEDARDWLMGHGLIDSTSRPTWKMRT
jgi:hypothetical protein